MPSFQVPVLGFLFVSFRPSSLRSHSCSASAYLILSVSVFPLPIRSLSLASLPIPATQPSVLPFRSPAVPPHSCFPARRLRSRFPGFPFLSGLISHAFLPGSRTRLRCPFPFVLPCFTPAAVPQVIPFQVSSPGSVPDFRFLSSSSAFSISLLSLCFFLSFSSRFHLTVVFPVRASAFASSLSPFSPA